MSKHSRLGFYMDSTHISVRQLLLLSHDNENQLSGITGDREECTSPDYGG